MALAACYECGGQVSTAAVGCPHCGAPQATQRVGTPVRTTELTSKRLKLHQLLSSLVLIVGLIWSISDYASARDPTLDVQPSATPYAVLGVALVWWIATKFRIWWHHE